MHVPVVFVSSDQRPRSVRRRWALGSCAAACALASVLLSSRFDTTSKIICAIVMLPVCFNLVVKAHPMHARYVFGETTLSGYFRNTKVFEVGYHEIEYAAYTAENLFWDDARYLPVAYGAMCLSTKPGFLVTIDLKRQRVCRAGFMMPALVKRFLLSLDEPAEFLAETKRRMDLARR